MSSDKFGNVVAVTERGELFCFKNGEICRSFLKGEEKIPSFLTGFMLQFLNIKVIILVMTAYSGFILPGNTGFTALLLGAFPLLAGIGGGNLIWSALGGLLRQYYNKYYRFINTVMALLLLWCAWRVLT